MQLDGVGTRRVRVRAQLLRGPARPGIEGVVQALVGVQAQDRVAAGLAIRARTRGLLAPQVIAALGPSGPLVLTWSLRGTRHLHHVDDVAWLLGILGPAFAVGSPARNRQLGIAGAAGDRAARAVRDELYRRGSLTRREMKQRLARQGVDPGGQGPIHVLRRVALEGDLCIVLDAAGEETYVALRDRVPAPPPAHPEAAAAELARRYLRGFGPAAPADFAAWSGLARGVAEGAWRAIARELTEVTIPGGSSWLLRAERRTAAVAAATPGPVRLLPAFDSLLLGYRDRGLLVSPRHARRVNAGGGMIRPTVLADDGLVGTWRLAGDHDSHRVEVSAFARLGVDASRALKPEIRDVSRFLEADSQ